MTQSQIDPEILERAKIWLAEPFDEQTSAEVKAMVDNDPVALVDAFYKDLEFGTGGLRGVMGAGTNKMNVYTIGMATQGLANYVLQSFPGIQTKVVIAHDCRVNSRLFAETAANVLTANNIKVYLFEDLRPTPELSFAVRHLGCQAGIMLTASHNPKEYNGYKVYWNDGGQLVPPHDKNTIAEVRKISSPTQVQFNGNQSLLEIIGDEVDEAYWNKVTELSLFGEGRDSVKVVFTPLHGTTINGIPQVLDKLGFTDVHLVEAQSKPDGTFPTVLSPNPEENAAMNMAIELAESIGADIAMGTDPDGDRVGIAVKNQDGKMVMLNGNEAASLLVYYVLNRKDAGKQLTAKDFVAKTIVTTNLIKRIAEHFKVTCFECLTGFKYIAELIREHEGERNYLVGGEESYGYSIGEFVRDKDAVSSAVMFAEIAAWAKSQGKNLNEMLADIHCSFGMFKEELISLTKKGKSGAEEIQQMMLDFRKNAPESINGVKVLRTLDYKLSEITYLATGTKSAIELPKSDVFQFELEDGSVITARPSGTEPKIKFYISVNCPTDKSIYEESKHLLAVRIQGIRDALSLN
jgi:phosphoglucomutase